MGQGDVIAERFTLLELAGRGGMGEVWRARDAQGGGEVALKLMAWADRGTVERFEREAEVLARLDHPGIVRYVADGTDLAGARYLAMEWVGGRSLGALLDAGEGLSLGASVALVRAAAEAIGHAHARGIIHRDLKPDNLLLPDPADPAGVRIVDFGVAHTRAGARLTDSGIAIGTPSFMAPEQARGASDITPAADVFALGCLLFELATGVRAYDGAHAVAILAKLLLEDPPRARERRPELPLSLERALRHLMARAPEERPPDGAAAAALLAGLEGTSLAAPRAREDEQAESTVTLREHAIISVVLGRDSGLKGALEGGPGAPGATRLASLDMLEGVVARFRAALHRLADGSVLAHMSGHGFPTAQAARAARCAIALRDRWPGATLVLSTGPGEVGGGGVVGGVIDRASRLLEAHGRPGRIAVDGVTRRLLADRFALDVEGEGEGEVGFLPEGGGESQVEQRTPLVGRERELSQLGQLVAWSLDTPAAAAALITGAAGIGKSRLRHEVIARAVAGRQAEPLVLIGRGDPVAAGAWGLLRAPLRRLAGVDGSAGPALSRARVQGRFSTPLPSGADAAAIATFMAELVGVPFDARRDPALRAARRDPRLMADRVREAWLAWLEAELTRGPMVWVLEDLQWADVASVRLIGDALKRLSGRPFFVLAIARPGVRDAHPGLWRDQDLTTIALRPVPSTEAERMVRRALGPEAADDAVQSVVERGEGNPFFLEELVRSHAEGLALPDTVLATVQARLAGLSGDARRQLRAASVFGTRFSSGGVAALVGASPEVVGEGLAGLDARDIVRPARMADGTFGDDWVFEHDLVREAAYAMLPGEERARAHAAAGDWLRRSGRGDPMVLARHFELGGALQQAVSLYLAAARAQLDANDLPGAAATARRGLACADDSSGEERAWLRQTLAEALWWTGHFEGAVEASSAVAAEAQVGSPAWCRAAGLLADLLGQLSGALDPWVEQLCRLGETREAPSRELLMALCRLGYQLVMTSRTDEARRVDAAISRVEGLLDEVDLTARARIHSTRGLAALLAGDLGEATKEWEACVACDAEAGDARRVADVSVNLGFALMELGALDAAAACLEGAIAAARSLALELVEANARHNLGMVVARMGRTAEGRALEEQAVATFERGASARSLGAALVYLAQICLLDGDPEAGRAHATRAAEILEPFPPVRAGAWASLAAPELALGRPEAAVVAARRGMAILAQVGALIAGEPHLRATHARALEAAGHLDEAQAAWREAARVLQERADRISDPTLRASFLDAITDHRETLARARGAG